MQADDRSGAYGTEENIPGSYIAAAGLDERLAWWPLSRLPRACSDIADQFGHASAWKFSKRATCFKTQLVVAPRPSAHFAAEICRN